jgi:hypothetical protein
MASLATGGALFVTGGLGMGGVWAADGAGSGFGSLGLVGLAHSVRLVGLNADGKEGEGQVPYSAATLATGPFGHALSSIVWPGGTAGNAGSTLGLLGNPACAAASNVHPIPGCPPLPVALSEKYPALNDDLKVESQTNSGDASDSINQGDGAVVMSATALEDDVRAESSVAGTRITGVGVFGPSSAAARTQLTGAKSAVSDASSQVRDVDLAAGVFKIGSVKSVAHAVTNGVTSSGTGSSVVTGFTIAKVPVTVDDKGIHVNATGGSAKAANDAVNKAVKNFSFQAYLTQPTSTTKGGDTTYNSGSLVIVILDPSYQSGANNDGHVLEIGGASVTASALPGFGGPLPPFVSIPPVGTTPTTTLPGLGASTGTGTTGGFAPAPNTSGPNGSVPPVQLAGKPLGEVFGGLSPAWAVAVLFGVGFMAAGFRRLPDRLLEDTGASCPLED